MVRTFNYHSPEGSLITMNEVMMSIILTSIKIPVHIDKKEKPGVRNYTNDNLILVIDLCKTSIERQNINTAIVELIVIILSIATRYLQKITPTIFEEVLKTDYANYIAFFTIELLKDLNQVKIKARMVFQEEQFEEYSYKLNSGAMSIISQEYLNMLGNRQYIDDSKTIEFVESAKDRLGSGLVFLIGVSFLPYCVENAGASEDERI